MRLQLATLALITASACGGALEEDDPALEEAGAPIADPSDQVGAEGQGLACNFSCARGFAACGCAGDFGAGCYDPRTTFCSDGRVTTCSGTTNPSPAGPHCCPGRGLAHPDRNTCDAPSNLSPRVSPHGTYLAASDRPNFMNVRAGVLELVAARVRDNGEGDDWPHGPYGNLYIDFFGCNEPLDRVPDGADRRRIAAPLQLRGPHRTHGTTDEWLDDEALFYSGAGIFDWGARTCVTIRVYESDSNSEDGNWLGRRNDVLCLERVNRASTTGTLTLSCTKYTNGHPRIRQPGNRTLWLHLHTHG